MATNENQVGVIATFDIQQFVKNQNIYVQTLNKTNAETEKQVKAQQRAAKSQEDGLRQVRQNFVSFAAEVTATVGALIIAYKTLEEAASFRAMIISGNDLATSYGVDFQKLLDGLDEVSRGALSMEQKVLIANRSLIAGGASFADKVPQLYKIASAAARATGQDVGFVFETLTKGIAKASPLLIDNAELYLKIGGAVEEYAAKLGKSSDQLTAQERQVAVLNAVLEQGNALVERSGKGAVEATLGFKQISASVTDFKMTLGLAADAILNTTNALGFMSRGLEAAQQVVATATAGIVYLYNVFDQVTKKIRGEQVDVSLPRKLADEAFLRVSGIVRTNAAAIAQGAEQTALEKANEVARAELDKRNKQIDEYGNKLRDIQIKTGESLLSAENDFRDKSAKAWSDYIKKSSEIIADGIKARAKIEQSYNDSIVKAQSDYLRGLEDLNYNHGNKLADIERSYQDRIREIQTTYQEDAQDAVRNLDAIALLRAKEKRDKDLTAARQSHDEEVRSEQEAYQRSLYELQRALQDKRDEAERDRRRALDEQRQNEQDAQDDAKQAYRDQLTDAQNAFAEKQATIRAQYAQEDAAAQAHYLSQEAALTNHLNAMQAIMARYGMLGGESVNPIRVGGGYRRAQGGIDIVNSPSQFTVGEAGPELMITAPLNRAIPTPATQIVNHVGDFSHSINAAIESSVTGMDGRITAAVRKALQEVIGR